MFTLLNKYKDEEYTKTVKVLKVYRVLIISYACITFNIRTFFIFNAAHPVICEVCGKHLHDRIISLTGEFCGP